MRSIGAIAFAVVLAPALALAQVTVPGSPTIVGVAPASAQASVTFSAPSSNGGSPITGYQVKTNPGAITASGTSSPILVTGLANGTTYTVTVVAINAVGSSAPSSPSSPFTPTTDNGHPVITSAPPPNGVVGTAYSYTYTAMGTQPVTYQLSLGGFPPGVTLGSSGSVTGTPTTAGNYTGAVTPQDSQGLVGQAQSFTIKIVTVPGAPTIGTATAGNAQATVSFTAPASDGNSPITNYAVKSTPGNITASGTSSPIVVTGLTNGVAYTFQVSAINAVGTGPFSASSNSVTPTAGTTPAFTSGTPPSGTFGVAYSFTFAASGSPAPTFSLSSGTLPTGLTLASTGALTGTPTATGTFAAVVAATNAAGVASQNISITIAPVAPGAPSIGTATGGNAQASVSFTPPTATGGAPITSYTVVSNPGGITATGTASPIVVTGLTNGTAYTFTVAATNSAGTGPASNASNSVTPALPPLAPVITTSAPPNGSFGVAYSHQFAATGTPPPTFALASGTFPQGLSLNSNGALTGIPSATGTSTGVVTASNSAGSASQSFSITIAATVPGAPTIGTATAGNGQASVSFIAPASTGGVAITRYTVTSSPGGIVATGSGSPIVVTGLTNGTAYTFTVVAANAVGASAASASSNAVTPSTSGVPGTPPVFPMVVTSNITATTTSAAAQIQPRTQDVGTTASVFVFAHAPASLLRKSLGKEALGPSIPVELRDDDYCVLAQVSSSGQLTSVSASTMQPFTTGVLTSQSQAITILNNVSTSSVAGTTFYVGYGSSASAMLSNGVYQSALSVPGTSQCTANLAVAPAPDAPGALSGLWWNSTESGWGIHFTQRRNIIFAAWYTYDTNGNPKWYVASSCAMPTGSTASSGTCNGTLYDVSGPTFFNTTFNPSLVAVAIAGTLQVNFQNENAATMTYTAAGVTRTIALTRQPIASGTTAPAVDYTDLWWNPSESGWGMAIAHQYGVMFLAWYVYDSAGKPVWYVASNCAVSGSSCSGTLYRTTGPPFGPTFDSSRIQVFTAGTVALSFTDANNGLLSYTVNGVSASKTITRQSF